MRALALFLTFVASGCTIHKLSTARSVISEQSQCPEPQVFVRELQHGWIARGCNQHWMCSGYDGPCSLLTCAEAAEQELLSCRIETKTHFVGVGAAVSESRNLELDDCALQYDNAMCQCAAVPVAAK